MMGQKVIITKDVTVVHRRTTRDRWLSWPWRPWVAERVEIVPAAVAHDKCAELPDGTLIMGETFHAQLRHELMARGILKEKVKSHDER